MEQIYRILKTVEGKGFARRNDFKGYWGYIFSLCEEQSLVERTNVDGAGYISVVLSKKGYQYIEVFETFMSFFKSDSFFKTLDENN